MTRVSLVAGLNPTSHDTKDDSHAARVTVLFRASPFWRIRTGQKGGKVFRVDEVNTSTPLVRPRQFFEFKTLRPYPQAVNFTR